MKYTATTITDVGIVKVVNQDSLLMKRALWGEKEILMAIVCDGLGGLSKGELASAEVVRFFSDWFNRELVRELEQVDMNLIASRWVLELRTLNQKMLEYGCQHDFSMGTTFTGMLCIDDAYLIVHVGDTRVYRIDRRVEQLTMDHTQVAQEVRAGRMTPAEARVARNRNVLTQCVGASKTIQPQVLTGTVQPGVYLLCSDGLRHKVTDLELLESLQPDQLKNKQFMHVQSRLLVELVKERGERDNISAILIRVR